MNKLSILNMLSWNPHPAKTQMFTLFPQGIRIDDTWNCLIVLWRSSCYLFKCFTTGRLNPYREAQISEIVVLYLQSMNCCLLLLFKYKVQKCNKELEHFERQFLFAFDCFILYITDNQSTHVLLLVQLGVESSKPWSLEFYFLSIC